MNKRPGVFYFPIICIVFVVFCSLKVQAQSAYYYTTTDSLCFAGKIDSIKRLFPLVSSIDSSEYAVAFYSALLHFPELRHIYIDFRTKPLHTTMATRPATALFKNRLNRGYRIYANNKGNFSGVYLTQLTFNQQVGVIGHELSHIIDYTEKSALRLVGNAIGYLFSEYRRIYEAQTDQRCIAHGLGWQLYDYVDFILNKSKATDDYKNMKRKYYLDEKQIESLIQQQDDQQK